MVIDSINTVKSQPSQTHFLLWVGIPLSIPHNGDKLFYSKGLKIYLFVAGDKEVTSTWVLLKNLYETHGVKALYTGKVKLKEENVLFNDALNKFYLRLYGVGHMIKDHSDVTTT